MNPIDLARTVVHWLEYQRLCERSDLFCEAYLSQPIGEYCLAQKPIHFEPEIEYPPSYQPTTGRRRSMDYAIYGKSPPFVQNVLHHAIEAKFVTANRIFTQEIFDDLYRLLWFEPTRAPTACRRWLLIAGYAKNITGKKGLGANVQLGSGRGKPKVPAFGRLLPTQVNNPSTTKPVHDSCPEVRQLWCEAARAFGQTSIPDTISLRLRARYPNKPRHTDALCLVWEIFRPVKFASIHPL